MSLLSPFLLEWAPHAFGFGHHCGNRAGCGSYGKRKEPVVKGLDVVKDHSAEGEKHVIEQKGRCLIIRREFQSRLRLEARYLGSLREAAGALRQGVEWTVGEGRKMCEGSQ